MVVMCYSRHKKIRAKIQKKCPVWSLACYEPCRKLAIVVIMPIIIFINGSR